ncbi:putative secreted protein [Litoreibacter ponti]|uniref:Putative secreted protein n=1 Tax=Litoreibacter ponti TaxID=1510457 RepID=A0A2T6BL09_9RHOB|nr:VPLPA-CTERM sorting domain-containing protein [Litoreibacter ponti]PTX56753.1 putative secreted protein [Litoreibacter ponti]
MKPVLLSLALLAASGAQASIITFEDVASGAVVTRAVSTDGLIGASVSASGGDGTARAFDTNDAVYEADLTAPFLKDGTTKGARSPGNVLVVQEDKALADGLPDPSSAGGAITFLFDAAVSFLGFELFDDVKVTITADTGASLNRTVRQNGKYKKFRFDKNGANPFERVQSLTFDFNGGSGAIDRLRFAQAPRVEDDLQPVPVPAGLPLLLAGLAGLALLRRWGR